MFFIANVGNNASPMDGMGYSWTTLPEQFFCKAQGDAVAEKLREVQCKDAVTTPLKINGWNPKMEVWFRSFSFLNG